MNLDELLKVNSVRCIKTKVQEDLVEGEIYKVEGFNDETIKIVDRNGYSSWHNKNLFEPVPNNDINLDELVKHLEVGRSWKEIGCNHVVTITEIESGFANNIMVEFKSDCCLSSSPLRMFLKDFTPVPNNDVSKSDNEIDISLNSVDDVNTTFKVGDRVYKYGETDVKTVLEVFELPPKETPLEDKRKAVIKKLLENKVVVLCKCWDDDNSNSEIMAIAMSPLRLIVGYSDGYFEENNGTFWKFAIPYDPKTNLPLTEDLF